MYIRHLLVSISAIALTLAMVIFPEATFTGASQGIKTWGLILVPSLLPFFIMADLLMELKICKFLGVLLDPVMRPIFNQPGEAGLILVLGFTSGFPMGAVLTNKLYEQQLCTKEEASRLIAFTNNCSPLFLLAAIPIGMLSQPSMGLLLLLSHYLSNILLGILLGLKKKMSQRQSIIKIKNPSDLYLSKPNGNVNFGLLINQALKKSINNLLTIGGFVVLFAVLIEILSTTHIIDSIDLIVEKLLTVFNFNTALAPGLTMGLMEITLGSQVTAKISATLVEKLMIISFILGWSGFSIQAQVYSIVNQKQIPIGHYVFGRLFQGLTAMVILKFLFPYFSYYLPVMTTLIFWNNIGFLHLFILNIFVGFLLLFLLIFLAISIDFHKKIFNL